MKDRVFLFCIAAAALFTAGSLHFLPALARNTGWKNSASSETETKCNSPVDPVVLDESDLAAIKIYAGFEENEFAPFAALAEPGARDWRSGPGKNETHQSFEKFRRDFHYTPLRQRVVLLREIGEPSAGQTIDKSFLSEFVSIYFNRPVRWEEPLTGPFKTRRGTIALPSKDQSPWVQNQWVQIHAVWIISMLARRIPEDALMVMGLAYQDLYPEDSWNFVFGMAHQRKRAGVYSLARLNLYSAVGFGHRKETPETRKEFLLRAIKILGHEIGHLAGLPHCTAFSCIMNGSNNLAETDRAPLHLCPLCLAKLSWSLGFKVGQRYEALSRFLAAHGLDAEAEWYKNRVKHNL